MDEPVIGKIKDFLMEFKRIASEGRGIDIVPRVENRDALAELGLTYRNCKAEIMSLSVADYCEGPTKDQDREGFLWVFGKEIGGKEVYIKLKIVSVGTEEIAKCISFHPARRPLHFPYRRKVERRRT